MVWYGLAGMVWYMVWPGKHVMVWPGGHRMVYGMAWHGILYGLAAAGMT